MLAGASLMDEANRTTVKFHILQSHKICIWFKMQSLVCLSLHGFCHAILRYLACAFPGVADHWYPSDLFKRSKIESVLDWHHSNLRRGAGEWSVFAGKLSVVRVEVSSPILIVKRAGSHAWTHKSWRVREEFARTVTSAIGLFASTELPLQRAILPPEMYTRAGPQFCDELQRSPFKEREEQEQEQEELTSPLGNDDHSLARDCHDHIMPVITGFLELKLNFCMIRVIAFSDEEGVRFQSTFLLIGCNAACSK
ncbi:hypothetical protein ACSBR1_017343 [Camellia fascicularis]